MELLEYQRVEIVKPFSNYSPWKESSVNREDSAVGKLCFMGVPVLLFRFEKCFYQERLFEAGGGPYIAE